MKSPLVSILMCTYNAASTIEETLLSCINQTYKNTEILVYDDHSTDETIKIIKQLNNPKIKIWGSDQKLWPYGWLNFLLDHAKGQYVAIQDHDDIWKPEKIEKQVTVLEEHSEYIGTWTKTRMWYEWDNKYFDYFLGEKNYYTLHPSLMFRNEGYRYPIGSDYMNDAVFQKMVLCKWEKKIYNIDEMLTIHRVKDWAKNYSYKWFTFSKENIQRLYKLHPWWYATAALFWEIMRKIIYPLLQKIGKGSWINKIERIPFKLQGYKIQNISMNLLIS